MNYLRFFARALRLAFVVLCVLCTVFYGVRHIPLRFSFLSKIQTWFPAAGWLYAHAGLILAAVFPFFGLLVFGWIDRDATNRQKAREQARRRSVNRPVPELEAVDQAGR
ncbi:hypothetical protein [Tellurirhabdus rosea]|uniref:hypothetical protein n=1 Tax=Tellurirhabdus rosea TaxID=2674997 RepID=UPI002256DE30|nr:hypothetical protein [Tellurirhabdus rosea]